LARSIGSPVAFTTRVAASGFAIFQYACACSLASQGSQGPAARPPGKDLLHQVVHQRLCDPLDGKVEGLCQRLSLVATVTSSPTRR
jgi:hypothetical protein